MVSVAQRNALLVERFSLGLEKAAANCLRGLDAEASAFGFAIAYADSYIDSCISTQRKIICNMREIGISDEFIIRALNLTPEEFQHL